MSFRATAALIGGTAILLMLIIMSLVLIPDMLHPPLSETELKGVGTAEARIQLEQAQAQIRNSARSTLLQAVAGLLVFIGAVATWRQVQVNREGQVTDRFTRAIDQVGSENMDVRIGGIYGLERVAKNSPSDRPQVQYVLAAFIRGHAPRSQDVVESDRAQTQSTAVHSLPWLYVRAPDAQAALNVLGRRVPSPDALRLYLSRVDLRSANLDNARLRNAKIRHADLSRSWMVKARMDGCDLCHTDLRQVNASGASFAGAILHGATLEGANLYQADLRKADLRDADMRASNLEGATLIGALVNERTAWPDEFSPDGVKVVNDPRKSAVQGQL